MGSLQSVSALHSTQTLPPARQILLALVHNACSVPVHATHPSLDLHVGVSEKGAHSADLVQGTQLPLVMSQRDAAGSAVQSAFPVQPACASWPPSLPTKPSDSASLGPPSGVVPSIAASSCETGWSPV